MYQNKITVIELFAGVGGFRLGLEGDKKKAKYYSPISGYNETFTPIPTANILHYRYKSRMENCCKCEPRGIQLR